MNLPREIVVTQQYSRDLNHFKSDLGEVKSAAEKFDKKGSRADLTMPWSNARGLVGGSFFVIWIKWVFHVPPTGFTLQPFDLVNKRSASEPKSRFDLIAETVVPFYHVVPVVFFCQGSSSYVAWQTSAELLARIHSDKHILSERAMCATTNPNSSTSWVNVSCGNSTVRPITEQTSLSLFIYTSQKHKQVIPSSFVYYIYI